MGFFSYAFIGASQKCNYLGHSSTIQQKTQMRYIKPLIISGRLHPFSVQELSAGKSLLTFAANVPLNMGSCRRRSGSVDVRRSSQGETLACGPCVLMLRFLTCCFSSRSNMLLRYFLLVFRRSLSQMRCGSKKGFKICTLTDACY